MPRRTARLSGNTEPAGTPQRSAPNPDAPPLPSGWVWTTIGEVCVIQSGVGFPKAFQGKKTGDFPVVKVSDISAAVSENKGVLVTAANYISWAEVETLHAKVFPPKSTVFAKIGEALRLNRRAFTKVPIIADNNVMGLIPEQRLVEPKNLYYFMHLIDLSEISRATTVPSVRKTDVARIAFPLAPLPEQRRIVARIEELFSQLDAAEEGLRRVQRNLKRYRAAVLKAAVEGRLVPRRGAAPLRPDETGEALLQHILAERRRKWEEQEWAKLVEKARKKAAQARRKARGLPARMKDIPPEEWQAIPEDEYRRYLPKDDRWKQKYKEPSPPDTSNLPPLPEGWAWATVEMVGEHRLGKMLDKAKNLGSPRPYLRNINVRWFGFDLSDIQEMRVLDDEMEKVSVYKGDLIVCEGGEPGRAAVWSFDQPMVIQKALHRVRLFDGTLPHFLMYCLAADAAMGRLEHYFTGSTIKHFTGQALRQYVFPLPPLEEQRRIVAEVERRLSVAREAEKAVEANLKRIARLRQAILKRAFEGKLVPQDPEDEPAAVLLERIRAGKTEMQDLPLFQSVN